MYKYACLQIFLFFLGFLSHLFHMRFHFHMRDLYEYFLLVFLLTMKDSASYEIYRLVIRIGFCDLMICIQYFFFLKINLRKEIHILHVFRNHISEDLLPYMINQTTHTYCYHTLIMLRHYQALSL